MKLDAGAWIALGISLMGRIHADRMKKSAVAGRMPATTHRALGSAAMCVETSGLWASPPALAVDAPSAIPPFRAD